MRKTRKLELQNKGWSDEDIINAENILEKEEKKDVFLSKIVFGTALVVIILANLAVSLVMVPFLIVFSKAVLYTFVTILAATIGFTYNFLITDIGHLEKKHHLFASIIVPLLTLVNMVVVVIISNRFISELEIQNNPHNPWVISIIFAVAFILPYLIDQLRIHIKNR